MWTPIVLTPPLTAAGIAARVLATRRAHRAAGGVRALLPRRPRRRRHAPAGRPASAGGFREPTYNLVMGPPLLAPGSLVMVGAFGLLAAVFGREGWR